MTLFRRLFVVCLLGQSLAASAMAAAPKIMALALPEPMGTTSLCGPDDANALNASLTKAAGQTDLAALKQFVLNHPDSCYALAATLNVALLLEQRGYYSQAMDLFKLGWKQGKGATKGLAYDYANRMGAELAKLEGSVGMTSDLHSLLGEIQDRRMRGDSAHVRGEALYISDLMHRHPEEAYKCGGNALEQVDMVLNHRLGANPVASHPKVGADGLNLKEMEELGKRAGVPVVAGRLSKEGSVPVPSVVLFKVGHYVAIVAEKHGSYELHDDVMRLRVTVSRSLLDSESTGIYLTPEGHEPASGWVRLLDKEKRAFAGKGFAPIPDVPYPPCLGVNSESCPFCADGGGGAGGGACGMPRPGIDLQAVALTLYDTPVKFDPAYGPRLDFTATYHESMPGQTTVPSEGGLGVNWSNSWDARLDSVLGAQGDVFFLGYYTIFQNFVVYGRGGGVISSADAAKFGIKFEVVSKYIALPIEGECQDCPDLAGYVLADGTIVGTDYIPADPAGVSVTYPSGWKEFYGDQNGTLNYSRLTKLQDPQGNAVRLGYDQATLSGGTQIDRLITLTSADNKVANLTYDPAHPERLVSVQEPSGATAHFGFDSLGRLTRLTDALNLTSTIDYDGANLDQIDGLHTPYGPWTVTTGGTFPNGNRSLDLVDPAGQHQRAQFNDDGTFYTPPDEALPTGMLDQNTFREFRNTYYWDAKAMADAGSAPAMARIYHWLHSADLSNQGNLLESVKMPLEGRIFYDYPGQQLAYAEKGATAFQPQDIGRVLDDGTTQREHMEYNLAGEVTRHVDPSGKELDYTYDSANLTDLLSVKDGSGETLASFVYADPNVPHRPTTIYDAGGNATTLSYNTHGQLLSVQLPTHETTNLTYDPNGYLASIAPPASGTTVNFTTDNAGRIATSDDTVNGHLSYDYDALNHLRHVYYPDTTYEEITYDKLDVFSTRDRDGRVTHYTHDAARHLTGVLDPANHLIQLSWCHCGALSALIDADGHTTSWDYDIEGRLTSKVYPDQTQVTYNYENTTSRLKSIVDAMQQQTLFSYNIADQLTGVVYQGAKNATAPVSFQYEPVLGRLSRMQDGTGLTQFLYNTIGSGNGAGRLASVNGPLSHSAVQYAYDASGRVISTGVNNVAETYHYDPTGQLDSLTNPLGTFQYGYDSNSGRLNSVALPNGAKTILGYFDPANSGRLQSISHQNPASAVLAQYGYDYDPAGQITQWTSQQGTDPLKTLSPSYDLAGQLTGTASSDGNVLSWAFDPAGNRTQSTWNGIPTSFTPNNLNQLTQVSPAKVKVAGLTNVTATVTVNGLAAAAGSTQFGVWVPEGNGKQVLTVTAQSGPSSLTQHYQVVNGQTLKYDLNGNLINDGQRQYDWDAANRLIRVSNLFPDATGSIHSSDFSYDGMGRRTEIKEKQGLQTVQDRRFVFDNDDNMVEERDASNNVVKRFYYTGVQVVSGPSIGTYSYLTDQLGSVRAVLDGSGNVAATYDYDLWGNRTQTAGTFVADIGFTSDFTHIPSGLALTPFRGYSPQLGRWISRDPLEETDGPNLYSYGLNNPVSNYDNTGGCAVPLVIAAPFLAPEYLAIAGGIAIGAGGVWAWNKFHENDNAPVINQAKGGKQNVRDSGLEGLPDSEIQRQLDDARRCGDTQARRRLEKEQKARKIRNRQKRCG